MITQNIKQILIDQKQELKNLLQQKKITFTPLYKWLLKN